MLNVNHNALTRFGLLRHARTEWNLQKRIQGQKDSPVAPEGEKQAGKWGNILEPFGWDRILSSDIGRALKTAELINETLGIPIHTEPGLREMDWGLWSGKTMAQLRQESPRLLAEQEANGWRFCPPGGEVLETVWQRSRQVLLEAIGKWPGEQILVITHEGVIKGLLYRFNSHQILRNEPHRMHPWHLHLLVYSRQELHLEKINALNLE
ncbi:MAG: histidine phosphatase family protein [Desulfobacterales bacterium]|nr:histidine phosphatase family protein [Desulfobacterales bacterium]